MGKKAKAKPMRPRRVTLRSFWHQWHPDCHGYWGLLSAVRGSDVQAKELNAMLRKARVECEVVEVNITISPVAVTPRKRQKGKK